MAYNDNDFEIILIDTLQHEGGYRKDPADPGGETNFGISKRQYPHLDIAHLSLEQVKRIYRLDYWATPGFARVEGFSLARKVFDLGVNTGPGTATRMLQRAINTVCTGDVAPRRRAPWRQKIVRLLNGKPLRVDGVIGPITLAALAATPYRAALLMALRGEAYLHYKKLNPLYIPGWLERLES